MNLVHDPETDMAYLQFQGRLGFEGFDLCDGVVVHLDRGGAVAGIELDRASERLDVDALRALAARAPAAAAPHA